MSIAVELTEMELAEIKQAANLQDDVMAVKFAMTEFLRHLRRMKLKELSGQVEMMDNWQELEASELISNHGQSDNHR